MCNDGDVRLVGGPTPNEGRIEMCYDRVWGSLCQIRTFAEVAAVVCRQLGYLDDGEQVLKYTIDYLSIRDHAVYIK